MDDETEVRNGGKESLPEKREELTRCDRDDSSPPRSVEADEVSTKEHSSPLPNERFHDIVQKIVTAAKRDHTNTDLDSFRRCRTHEDAKVKAVLDLWSTGSRSKDESEDGEHNALSKSPDGSENDTADRALFHRPSLRPHASIPDESVTHDPQSSPTQQSGSATRRLSLVGGDIASRISISDAEETNTAATSSRRRTPRRASLLCGTYQSILDGTCYGSTQQHRDSTKHEMSKADTYLETSDRIAPSHSGAASTQEGKFDQNVESAAGDQSDSGDNYDLRFTGLRELCSFPKLLGRSDSHWKTVRKYMNDLTPQMARIACETREGKDHESALHLACRQKPPPDVVKMLLYGSTLPTRWKTKSMGWLPLHVECRNGTNTEVVRMLTEAYPESVHAVDNLGRTPLHIACQNMMIPPKFEVLWLLMSKNSINTKSNEGVYPISLKYLSDRAGKLLYDEVDETHCAKDCLDAFLDACMDRFEGLDSQLVLSFISIFAESPAWFREHGLSHAYVQAALNWAITDEFLTAILMLDFYVVAMLIVFFRLAGSQALDVRSAFKATGDHVESIIGQDKLHEPLSEAITGWWTVVTPLYGGVFYLLLRKVLRLLSTLHHGDYGSWFTDFWNWLDCSCIYMVLRTALWMHYGTGDREQLKLLIVITTGILWMMVLSVLKQTKRFSIFVSAVLHVTVALRSILMTLGIFFTAFAQMYFTEFRGTRTCTGDNSHEFAAETEGETRGISSSTAVNFCTMKGSFLKVFVMLTGGGIDEIDYASTSTTIWLSVIFAVLVVILLLNVLIAVVTDSYQDVKNHGDTVFWSHRQHFVYEVGRIGILVDEFIIQPLGRAKYRNERIFKYVPENVGKNRDESTEDNYSNQFQLLWEIISIAYADPTHFAVYKKKQRLKKRANKFAWLLGTVSNPLVSPDLAKPSYVRRVAFALLIPLWIFLGLITAGWMWPPQIREYLFCTSITEKSDGKNPASFDDVEAMRRELRKEVRNVETLMDAKLDAIRSEVEDMKNNLEVKMNTILDMLSDVTLAASQPSCQP